MRYHNITKDDMRNGDGLRVVLWLSGCSHHCKGCQNPITWDPNGGIVFSIYDEAELMADLQSDYIQGLTLSGGDPFYEGNQSDVLDLVQRVKKFCPDKDIWVYTGSKFEDLKTDYICKEILRNIDVLVDGEFVQELADVNYKWAGSTNQRVINVPESLKCGEVVLHD